MKHYECPFEVGDMVIPVKPLNRLEGPNWASGMDDMEGNTYCIYNIARAKTDIILSELVMNQMNVRGNLWING